MPLTSRLLIRRNGEEEFCTEIPGSAWEDSNDFVTKISTTSPNSVRLRVSLLTHKNWNYFSKKYNCLRWRVEMECGECGYTSTNEYGCEGDQREDEQMHFLCTNLCEEVDHFVYFQFSSIKKVSSRDLGIGLTGELILRPQEQPAAFLPFPEALAIFVHELSLQISNMLFNCLDLFFREAPLAAWNEAEGEVRRLIMTEIRAFLFRHAFTFVIANLGELLRFILV